MALIIAAMMLLTSSLAFGQAYQWTTFTSVSDVVDLVAIDGHVWAATKGGVFDYSMVENTFDVFTNTRGLSMNNCVAIGEDARGYVWAGHTDGGITRISTQTGRTVEIGDLRGEIFDITDILNIGDEVFVATNNGIYRFAYYGIVDNYRVLETIKVLGSFPGESRVTCLSAYNGYLYAGTQFGIARAQLGQPQYNAPDSWENWTSQNSGLPENDVRAMAALPSLWIATAGHIIALDANGFACDAQISGVRVISSDTDGQTPVAATLNHVYRLARNGSLCEWIPVGQTMTASRDIVTAENGLERALILGSGDSDAGSGGLSFLDQDSTGFVFTDPISAPGIGGNVINTLAVGPNNRVWAGGIGFNNGVYSYDGNHWTNFTRSTGYTESFYANSPLSIALDDFGGAWVSTYGGGVAWYRENSITYFNARDSSGFSGGQPRFGGIMADPTFIVGRVAHAPSGDMYITDRLSSRGQPLVRVPAEWIARGNNPDPWDYLSNWTLPQPGDSFEIEEVLVDPMERVWLGCSRDGIAERSRVYDPSNNAWFSYVASDRQDAVTCFDPVGKEVLDWAIDAQGYLWIATTNGAYYTQGGVPYDLNQLRFICVLDLPLTSPGNPIRVNAIHVDAQDNKWFGTEKGVAVLDRNFSWVHIFQTASSVENRSGLVSNNATSIASNPQTGEVWIGTDDGLSRYTSPYVSSDIEPEIWPYPSPFRADGSQKMCIDPQRYGRRFDELRILTLSGKLVRKLTWSEMLDCPANGGWDGRNDDGEWVAGGIYVLVATTSDGESTTGKVAVLGR